ncbi:hypothetical protein EV426DRAFT_576757 [Tirmania nivea]|nr:hypothetical protein EV426DRAFT_576757 [Tirmania nivea]
MASTAAARRPSFEKKRSTSNLNLTSNRSSSTANLVANDDDTHTSTQHRPHKTKQFVVHAGRHHTRVPSYGRNLNKLSKLTLAHDGGTTSKGHHLERGGSNGRKNIRGVEAEGSAAEEKRQNTSKKPAFEIGDSDEDTANEEEEVVVKHSPVRRTNGLKKSSSTKSLERHGGARGGLSERAERLERPPKERLDRSVRPERSERSEILERSEKSETSERPGLAERAEIQDRPERVDSERERGVPRERESVTFQLRRPSRPPQAQPEPEPMASSARTLVDHERKSDMSGVTMVDSARRLPSFTRDVVHPAAAPPQINSEYATGLHTPASSGVSAAYSNNQALTSRFIESPGRSGASTSVSPGYTRAEPPQAQSNGHATRPSSSKSTQSSPPPVQRSTFSGGSSSTASIPSRTQQKLWLQRQFDEDAQQVSARRGIGQNGLMGSYAAISQRELERTTREFYNVRRFKDPIGEGLERIREHPKLQKRIPRKLGAGEERDRGIGLSRSLNASLGKGGKGVGSNKGLKGSRDDSGINGSAEREEDARDPNVEALLKQLWNTPHLLTSNE